MGCSHSQEPATAEYIVPTSGSARQASEDDAQVCLGSFMPRQVKISSCYKFCEQIGEGASSTIYSAKKFGQVEKAWAVKVVKIPTGERGIRQIINEMEIWRRVGQHRNIVECHEVFEEPSRYCLRYCFVMERCAGGVADYIWRQAAINEKTLSCVFAQMLSALSHVHSLGVVHRDVKPDNFLYSGSRVKLSDFGLSLIVPAKSFRKGDAQLLPGVAGTAPFMSPEMVAAGGHSLPTDVWSFGAMAYVMLLGHFPYQPLEFTAATVKAAIARGSPSPSFEPCAALCADPRLLQPFGHVRHAAAGAGGRVSQAAVSFLRTLLQRDPHRRVDARAALQDPFLKGVARGQREPLPCLRENFRMAMFAGAFNLADVSTHKNAPQEAISNATTDTGGSV